MVDIANNWSPVHTYPYSLENATFFSVFKTICVHSLRFRPSTRIRILDPSAYGFGDARVNSGNKWRPAGVAKIWFFGPHRECSFIPTKTFFFFYIYFIAKVLCCFGIGTEEINGALKEFSGIQGSCGSCWENTVKLKVHRFESWNLHMLDSWLNICVDYFTKR